MNVIQVINEPKGGGAEFLVRELNSRLPAYGVQSKAVYLSNKDDVELKTREFCLDVKKPRSPASLNQLRIFLNDHSDKETIIHGHLTDALFALILPGFGKGLAKIFTEHNTYNKRRGIPFFRPLEKKVYGKYDKVVCISEATRTALLGWLGKDNFTIRTEMINNGARLFDLPQKSNDYARAGLRLISVGSLVKRKGLDIAIEALAQLHCPVSQYTVVGEGRERQRLERQAAALGVSHLVDFVGWRDDIECLLHRSDVQLIPSRWEGFGLVAAEGLSVGVKIVAADVPGLNEVLHDLSAAQLVEPENPAALARGIEAVWSQRGQWSAMSVAARQRAETFSLDKMVENYARVYSQVVESRTAKNCE